MKIVTLGIDPGLTGGYAMLTNNGELIEVGDLPVIRDGKSAWIDAEQLVSTLLRLKGSAQIHATTERVHAMPKNGSQAAFSQGCTFGSILAALQVAGARIEFVAPQTWKKQLGLRGTDLTDTQRKRASLDKARLLYPTADLSRQKDHGRAEALLIAHFAAFRNLTAAA